MSGCEIVFVEADRQWPVKVCIGVDLDRHEFVPWDFGHCVEDSIIQGGQADIIDLTVRTTLDRNAQIAGDRAVRRQASTIQSEAGRRGLIQGAQFG
jgi:hypothetical protein